MGFAHFHEILTSDEVFWKAAANSLTWGLVAPIVDIPLALGLALILHARVPFAKLFRTFWFTPVLMSYPVVGVIWLWVYNYDWGMANLLSPRHRPRRPCPGVARRAPQPRCLP